MAGKNENLHKAKDAKQDEFYTELPQIVTELSNYTDKFQDKVVFCNCDDPFESNFVKYFLMNFNRLGLKELIATGYATSPVRGTELDIMDTAYVLRVKDTKKYLVGTQKDLDAAGAKYFLTAEKGSLTSRLIGNVARDDTGNPMRLSIKEKDIDDNGKERTRTVKQNMFYEAGDFRSDMSVELLKQADIVVTNPPFSLFREYVAQLIEYDKQFLIIGNQNAITYKEFFPLIRDNKVWLGSQRGCISLYFRVPETYEVPDNARQVCISKFGEDYCRKHNLTYMRTACWFTNIDHKNRHIMLPLDLGYTYYGHEDMYPKYDNYNAINVDKTEQIPSDYMGVMGVPISFLYKYCPEQFEIVAFRKGEDGQDLVFTREREREFNRTFVSLYDGDSRDDKKRRRRDKWEEYIRQNNNQAKVEPIDLFYPVLSIGYLASHGKMPRNIPNEAPYLNGKWLYNRILIRRKEKYQ